MAFVYPFNFLNTRWRIIDGDIYVSHLGSDLSGSGSPRRPYKSIQHAINMASTGAKIVTGTGDYNETVDGQDKSCRLMADGTVLMHGTPSTTAFTNIGPNGSIRGFTIDGYQAAVSGSMKELMACVIRSALSNFSGTIQQTVIAQTTIDGIAPMRLVNCTLIGVSAVTPAAITHLESCYLDTTTSLQLSAGVLTYFDYCNQASGSVTQIDGNPYNTPTAVNNAFATFQQYGQSADAQFNRPSVGDYTLTRTSVLKTAGRRKTPVGALGEAISMGTQEILLGGSASAITLDANNYVTLPNSVDIGTVETPVIDLGSPRPIRTLRLYAEQVFDEATFQLVSSDASLTLPGAITIEMRYADKPTGMAYATYQPMIWDMIVSHDHRFYGNGHRHFEIRTNRFITTRCMQFRITLRNAGDDIIVLAQEDDELLLQEDERKLQV